jgi:hypothetical protein
MTDLQLRVAAKENQKLADVGQAIVKECIELVTPMIERLDQSDPKFSQPMIERVQRLVDALKRLDITGNAELELMFVRIDALVSKFAPEVLNVNVFARKSVKDELANLMKNMEGYI